MNKTINEYLLYTKSFGYRKKLYQLIAETFNIKKALYPGSHIDITPSLFIPKVIYIDSFRGAIKFFKNSEDISSYINQNKLYKEDGMYMFYGEDYNQELPIEEVDLIISQFAGFVGQATKRYLKKGGLLLANDSHGDATLAFLDDDFDFVGVIDTSGKINKANLDQYFTFARKRNIDVGKVKATMKGPKYKNQVSNYLFRKK